LNSFFDSLYVFECIGKMITLVFLWGRAVGKFSRLANERSFTGVRILCNNILKIWVRPTANIQRSTLQIFGVGRFVS